MSSNQDSDHTEQQIVRPTQKEIKSALSWHRKKGHTTPACFTCRLSTKQVEEIIEKLEKSDS